ncbi:hypothetical protein [Amycolatopsis pigmentata]|uniref:FXSXX-COOH protein n=1 Tax=Amycolatopsis pigmentata TaxID=450801 RepID=A0ABW5FN20_9PSEU
MAPRQPEGIPSALLDLSGVSLRELGTLAGPEVTEAINATLAMVAGGGDEVQDQREDPWRPSLPVTPR